MQFLLDALLDQLYACHGKHVEAKPGTVVAPTIAIITKITSGLFLGIDSTIDINLKKFDGNLNINGTIIKLVTRLLSN